MKTCKIVDDNGVKCMNKSTSKDMCITHYKRWKNGSNLTAPVRVFRRANMSDRELREFIMERCTENENGCLIWNGATTAGFPYISIKKKKRQIRRWIYELDKGVTLGKNEVVRMNCSKICLNSDHMVLATTDRLALDMVEARQDKLQQQVESEWNATMTKKIVRTCVRESCNEPMYKDCFCWRHYYAIIKKSVGLWQNRAC